MPEIWSRFPILSVAPNPLFYLFRSESQNDQSPGTKPIWHWALNDLKESYSSISRLSAPIWNLNLIHRLEQYGMYNVMSKENIIIRVGFIYDTPCIRRQEALVAVSVSGWQESSRGRGLAVTDLLKALTPAQLTNERPEPLLECVGGEVLSW